jgi:hypothetical protein
MEKKFDKDVIKLLKELNDITFEKGLLMQWEAIYS